MNNKKKQTIKAALVAAGTWSGISVAQAGNYIWESASAGLWSDGVNWSPDAPAGGPVATDSIIGASSAQRLRVVGDRAIASIGNASSTTALVIVATGSQVGTVIADSITASHATNSIQIRNDTGTLNVSVGEITVSAGSAGGSLYFGTSSASVGNQVNSINVTGTTTVSGGSLVLNISPSGTNNLGRLTVNGGSVRLNQATGTELKGATITTVGGLQGSGGIIENSANAVGAGNNSTLNIVNASDYTSATVIQNSAVADTTRGVVSLSKTGAGTQTLTGASTYTGGTVISEGALRMGAGGTVGSILGDVNILGSDAKFIIDRSNTGTFAGAISGNGSFVKAGAGTWTLSGTNTYAGGTVIEAGRIRIASDENLGASSGSVTFAASAPSTTSLEFTAGVTSNRDIIINASTVRLSTEDTDGETGGLNTTTLGGTISGAGGIDKRFVGNLVLTGDNTYAGTTTVSSGTLLVDGTHTGGGAYTVNGTLGGTGTISAAGVAFASAGKLSAGGVGTGTLSFDLGAGSLDLSTIDTTGSLFFDLGGVDASDRVVLGTGTLDLGVLNFSEFAFTLGEGFGEGVYTLFDSSATVVGSILESSGVLGGYDATLSVDGVSNNVLLTVTSAIPEPASFALGLGAAAVLAVGLRRRRRAE